MTRLRVSLTLMLAVASLAPLHGGASRQSFIYVGITTRNCRYTSEPSTCPSTPRVPGEVLVFDAQTLGIVTRIPLPRETTIASLAISPDGTRLYGGDLTIDLTRHVALNQSVGVGIPGTGGLTVSPDGQRLFQVRWARDTISPPYDPGNFVNVFDAASGTQIATLCGVPGCLRATSLASTALTDRVFIGAEQILELDPYPPWYRQLSRFGPANVSALAVDRSRLFAAGAAGVEVRDLLTKTLLGTLADPGVERIQPGARGRRVFTLKRGPSGHLSAFDARTLNPGAEYQIPMKYPWDLAVEEDEAELFVIRAHAHNVLFTHTLRIYDVTNALDVIDTASGSVLRSVALPMTSGPRGDGRDGAPPIVATPAGAPRCSYELGSVENVWTISGGTTTIPLTTGCAWMASSDASWARLDQTSGTSSAALALTIDPAVGPEPRTATLTIAGQFVTISQAGHASRPPFGSFDTPQEYVTGISGSLAVTGWALDDAGVTGVRILRDPVAGEPFNDPVFLGNATTLAGARPDVAAAFPSTAFADRAGWGLNLLTNMLPNQGNGMFRIYAQIDDIEGNTTILGPRTFSSSNSNSVVPFGAIDTPGQRETVSGTIVNFGWALTPLPNVIPFDGSTIDVLIDGVVVGHPTFGQPRADISELFPGYRNSNNAVGYFLIDTTQYDNGVHTIAWIVRDNAGNAAGIGSRYFRIQN